MFRSLQEAKRAAEQHQSQHAAHATQAAQALAVAAPVQDTPTAPLVFQCAKCRNIVGDSLSLGDADEAAQTITLSSASHVQKTNQVFTPHSGKDVGSSYFPITCAGCKTQLGKFYITTLRSLDHLREKYTFNIATLTSYALGQSEQGFNAADAVSDAMEGRDVDASTEHDEGLASKVDELSEEVVKIEHVMLSLTERVQTIEQQLAMAYAPSTAVSTPARLQTHAAMTTPTSSTIRPTPDRPHGSSESKRQRIRS